jgi:predicted O-methyltransferase YrrM
MFLTKEAVDCAIERVKQKLPQYQIKPKNLAKFGDSEVDKEFLSYINGVGGSYMKFVPLLIQELELHNIVELGNREGLSTLTIYDNLPQNASFITIDIVEDQRYCPDNMFTDHRVKFLLGDACDLAIFDSLPSGISTEIDFLFTDTIHFDYQLRDEWAIYQHLLADRALVAIDDINLNDKRKLFDELNYEKWDLTDLCHVSGWGLFLFERKEKLTREKRILTAYQASASIWRRKCAERDVVLNRIERMKLQTIARNFVHSHKCIHRFVTTLKKSLN